MDLRRPLRRPPRRVTFWALAGVSLLAAHDAAFLVQLGPGAPLARALRDGGHAYWEAASTLLLALAALAVVVVGLRFGALWRRARALPVSPAVPVERARGALAMRLWIRLLAVVGVGFTIQENVEHLVSHEHVIGLGALIGSEYPLALPVLALVTLAAALVGAAVLRIERDLLAAVASVDRRRGRAPLTVPRPPLRLVFAKASPLATRGAGRAPPHRLVFASFG